MSAAEKVAPARVAAEKIGADDPWQNVVSASLAAQVRARIGRDNIGLDDAVSLARAMLAEERETGSLTKDGIVKHLRSAGRSPDKARELAKFLFD
ncbi:MAG: hypothetical protein ACK50Q_15670 [Labrys sp. (in: a-proteobacteria)]